MNNLFKMLAKLARGMGSRYHYKKTVKCAESDQPAEILVGAFSGSPSKRKKTSYPLKTAAYCPKGKAARRVA